MENSPICIDASVVVQLLVSPDGRTVQAHWKRWLQQGRHLLAPSLLFYEATNAFHQYRRGGYLSTEAVNQALGVAMNLPIEVMDLRDLHSLALALSEEYSFPATYDAHYLALAKLNGAQFWTLDKRLVARVQSKLPWVYLIE